MSEGGVPKVTRRALLTGAAGAGRRRRGPGRGQLLAGPRQPRLAEPRQEGDRHRHRRDGPAAVGEHDEGGPAAQLEKLRAGGGFSHLGTSTPPQSPVAWANFINGAGPGSHGIFDFIHRHPEEQCEPVLLGRRDGARRGCWEVGDHRLQLDFWPFNHKPPATVLRRQGVPFWDYLDAAGIPSTFYDLPSNYPASPSQHGHHRCICGMGTPDMLGHLRHLPVFRRERARPSRSTKGAASGRG